MIRILIADDEKLIRAGIKKILSDAFPDAAVITEAKNGAEAYSACEAEKTDLLITDIRMPILSGTELMQKTAFLEHRPAIIVLSGFDDFSYAKAAIDSGAVAYVLKPVDEKELLSAVDKALAGVKKEMRSREEASVRALVSEGRLASDAAGNGLSFAKDGMYCLSISGLPEHEDVPSFFEGIPCYVVERKRGLVTLVSSASGLDLIREKAASCSLDVGVSSLSCSASDIRRLRQESFKALLSRFFEDGPGCGRIYFYPKEEPSVDLSGMDLLYEKVTASLDLLNEESVRRSVRRFLDFTPYQGGGATEALFYAYNKIVSGLFARYPKLSADNSYLYLKALMIENIFLSSALGEWKRYVLDYVLFLMELLKSGRGKYAYVTKALDYIARHYMEDITMATVANYVSMNYTWFSEKFKEQTGINFNDYLKRFRMDQAKRLLETGTYKVYEVAEKCGFKDVKHFMKSFREMNGMSAGDWARTRGR